MSKSGSVSVSVEGESGHQLFKLWPVSGRAGDLFTIYLFATGCLELGSRAGEVLRLRRDAGVAVNHPLHMEQNSGTKKAKPYQPVRFVTYIWLLWR